MLLRAVWTVFRRVLLSFTAFRLVFLFCFFLPEFYGSYRVFFRPYPRAGRTTDDGGIAVDPGDATDKRWGRKKTKQKWPVSIPSGGSGVSIRRHSGPRLQQPLVSDSSGAANKETTIRPPEVFFFHPSGSTGFFWIASGSIGSLSNFGSAFSRFTAFLTGFHLFFQTDATVVRCVPFFFFFKNIHIYRILLGFPLNGRWFRGTRAFRISLAPRNKEDASQSPLEVSHGVSIWGWKMKKREEINGKIRHTHTHTHKPRRRPAVDAPAPPNRCEGWGMSENSFK